MPTRLSKKKLDEAESTNSLAARIVAQTTGQKQPNPPAPPGQGENPAAVALGRKLGASKGGKARAEKLSGKRRKEIARAAASVRWQKNLTEGE